MSTYSNTMSTVGAIVALQANSNASAARQEAEKLLHLQCKATYDEKICPEVCKETVGTATGTKAFWTNRVEYVEVNDCTGETSQPWVENHISSMGFGTIIIGLFVGMLVVLFIHERLQPK